MSTSVFLLLCCGYVVFCTLVLIINLMFGKNQGSIEDYRKSRLEDDVNRMRQLQDIEYYKQVFQNKTDK